MSFSIATLVHSQNFKKPNTEWSISQKVTAAIDGILITSLVVIVALAVLDQCGVYLGLLQGIGSIGPGVWGFGCAIALVAIGDVIAIICWKKPVTQDKKVQDKQVQDKQVQDKAAAPPQANMLSTAEKASKKAYAVLFVSISGHPPHYGHLALGDTAAQEIKKFYGNTLIFFSLCPQDYLISKMKSKGGPIPSFEERRQQLETLLTNGRANGMFQGVNVQFWNDQENKYKENQYSDHPDSYRRLVEHFQEQADVFMVGGTDLCKRMGAAWAFMKHVVVVTRGDGDPDTLVVKNDADEIIAFKDRASGEPFVHAIKDETQSRILLQNAYPQFESVSSTAIRENKIKNEFPVSIKV